MRRLWSFRLLILSAFIFFDVLATSTFISYPQNEGNLIVKALMERFGIHAGLVIATIFITSFLLLILSFCSLVLSRMEKASIIVNVFVDACLGWFIAGAHFVGGTSWFWCAPEMLRHCLGTALYFVASISFLLMFNGQK